MSSVRDRITDLTHYLEMGRQRVAEVTASLLFRSPTAAHPGTSGEYAEKPVAVRSITIG